MEQGSFDEIMIEQARVKNEILAKEFDRLLRQCAGLIDSQRLAAVNGISYQYVRAFLNTNGEPKPVPKDVIPSLMTDSPDAFMEIVGAWIVEICGYKLPAKKSPMTAEEKVEALERRIKECRLTSVFKDVL